MCPIAVDMPHEAWDSELPRLNGHPWQSAAWGRAERETNGVEDHRLRVSYNDSTIQMVRVEVRNVAAIGKLAWIRRGPTGPSGADRTRLDPQITDWLTRQGFVFAVTNPYCRHCGPVPKAVQSQTIWIDLTVGHDQLWSNLKGNLRRGVSRAQRGGVAVTATREPLPVSQYFKLCQEISRRKGFELRTSEAFFNRLLNAPNSSNTEARLFIASCNGEIAAGAFIYRCGHSIHYMNGTSNRNYATERPGDLLHWSVIVWALGEGCTWYDLEGIDPVGNPGTYDFKKKISGEQITLASRWLTPLNPTARVLAPLAQRVLDSRLADLRPIAHLIRGTKAQPAS